METISLLYKTPPGNRIIPENKALREAIYNLNIDRTVSRACKSQRQSAYFLSVLSKPAENEENAKYRAEILRDFLKYPNLLSEMLQLFKSYDTIKGETEEMTAEIFRYGIPAQGTGLMDCTYEELYINAHFARNVIACFYEILNLFSAFEVRAEGLCRMKDLCKRISESKCIDEIEKAAETFRSESAENYRFTVRTDFGRTLASVSSHIELLADKNEKTPKKLNIKELFRKKEEIPSSVDIGSEATDNVSAAVTEAMSELSGIFSDIGNGLYSAFYGIGEELQFFSVACDIADYLKKAGMGYVFPEVMPKESDALEADGIFDPLLIGEGKNKDTIVTNKINADKNGILAMGDNNCGKTSFLRAVGCGIIFACNGLFVCADRMKVSIKDGVFTHFSSAEKDFSESDAAGRFEGEVKDIARIVDALTPYSVVLLNETFQSTAYREGAEGMKAILNYFPEIKVKYIFVTHMKAMFASSLPENVTLLKAEKYSLLPFENKS